MTDTRELHRLLNQLVDGCEQERGDWPDVVRRAAGAPGAEPPPQPRRTSRRRLVLALAMLVALVALLATPAFGLREALLGLIGRDDVEFERSPAAATVVKRQFADLAIGAPPGMNPEVVPNEARRVVVAGTARRRVLDVAPTRRGGFCYLFERSHGGCQRNEARPLPAVALTYRAGKKPGEPARVEHLGGTVNDARATRLTVEFGDGTTVELPFTWISAPIDAGFFAYDVPAARQTEPRGPRSVTAWAADGRRLFRDTSIRYPADDPPPVDPSRSGPVSRSLPSQPAAAPTEPIRISRAHGAVLTVGANNSVLFDSTALEAERRGVLEGRSAGFACFRIVTQYGATYARGFGVAGRFADRVGHVYHGLGPLDGCEIQGSYGHRWPDRFDSHSPVELPLTERGRRHFDDRAAARDLALFVRRGDIQRLRRRPPDEVARELARRYPTQLAELAGAGANPPAGRIGYHAADDVLTFVRLSETGRRFTVTVEQGKLTGNNLGDLAMVF